MSSQEESTSHLVPIASSSQKSKIDEETQLDRTETVSVSSVSQSYGSSSHMSDFIVSDDHESVANSQQSSASYRTAWTSNRSYSSDSNTVTSNELKWYSPNWSQTSQQSTVTEFQSGSDETIINSEAEEDNEEQEYPSSAQASSRRVKQSEAVKSAKYSENEETEAKEEKVLEPYARDQLRALRVDPLIPNLYADKPIYGSQCEHMPDSKEGTNVRRSMSLSTFKYDLNH